MPLTKISELAINSLQCYICSSLALTAQIECRSHLSCTLDLDLWLNLRSRSNGRGLDLDLWPSLRSRSNSHGLDLDLWPSLRSRSNGCRLDLDLWPLELDLWLSHRSRSNLQMLDLDLRLGCRSRSNLRPLDLDLQPRLSHDTKLMRANLTENIVFYKSHLISIKWILLRTHKTTDM